MMRETLKQTCATRDPHKYVKNSVNCAAQQWFTFSSVIYGVTDDFEIKEFLDLASIKSTTTEDITEKG